LYQLTVSPMLGPCCRFYPSCSEYALEAFRTKSFGKAFLKTIGRLLRCAPYSKGGYDPLGDD
ncbi:MAG: membrane protein insertion efficiency factor YidD, partial [Chlamydiae bacterium]|nr:membrane protein insertion efficiency factor YidD [Chlamydiota bacterium]